LSFIRALFSQLNQFHNIAMSNIEASPNTFPWPPVLTIAMLVICYGLTVYVPIGWQRHEVPSFMPVSGYLLAAAAIALDIWAFTTFSKHRANVMPHRGATKLLTGGPFSLSRNPIYLANIMLVTAVGFILASRWFLFGAALLFVLLHYLAIRREEKHMAAKFPVEWQEYTLRVRRWI